LAGADPRRVESLKAAGGSGASCAMPRLFGVLLGVQVKREGGRPIDPAIQCGP